MIRLTAEVDILSSDNGVITTTSNASAIKNNISVGFADIIEHRVPLTNPFIIGISKVGDGTVYSNYEKYFISRQIANGNGMFAEPIEFTIYGDKITAFTIAFDVLNKRHPTSITVDGYTQQNDDAVFTVSVDEANEHTIRIENWNTANQQLIITGLYVQLSINIDFRNLISINRSIFDRGDLKLPSWGILSNVGSMEFIDTDYEVRDYVEQELLVAGSKIEITLRNTLADTKEEIGIFYSDTWDYDNDNRKVTVSLKDDLEEWQNILLDEYSLKENQTMYDVYLYLVSKTPKKWQFALDKETKTFLQSITCKYTYLNSGNLWAQWAKLCEIGMLHIYKNNENNVVVKKSM
jgi:hypothetical protein